MACPQSNSEGSNKTSRAEYVVIKPTERKANLDPLNTFPFLTTLLDPGGRDVCRNGTFSMKTLAWDCNALFSPLHPRCTAFLEEKWAGGGLLEGVQEDAIYPKYRNKSVIQLKDSKFHI